MDKCSIRIIRSSDEKEFHIGNGTKWGLLTDGLDGFETVEKDITYLDSAIGDGGIIVNERLGKKDRTISARWMELATNTEARDSAQLFFRAHDTYKVYLAYGSRTVWFEGSLYRSFCKMPPDEGKGIDLILTFTAESPFLNGADVFGKDIAGEIPMEGFPYISKIEGAKRWHPVARIMFDKNVFVNNRGDVATQMRVVMKASGYVKNPAFYANDHMIRLIDEMRDNDVVEIDFAKKPPTVRKNGVNCMGKCDRRSEFNKMDLRIGQNVLRYEAESGENVLSVSVFYNQMYGAV